MDGSSSKRKSMKSKDKNAEEEQDMDALVILRGIADYKATHEGKQPVLSTMASFLDTIKGSLRHKDLTPQELYNKFCSLKKRFQKVLNSGGDPGPTEFHHTFFYLSTKAWGDETTSASPDDDDDDDDDDDEEEEEEKEEVNKDEDVDQAFASFCATYKDLAHQLRIMWEEKGNSLHDLKLMSMKMDKTRAKELDKKWKQHYAKGLEIKSQRLRVESELTHELAAHK